MPFLDKILQKIDRVDTQRLEGILKCLAQERDFLEKVFNLLVEGIVVADREDAVVFANRAALQILSAGESGLVGKDLKDVIKDPTLRRLIGEALANRRGVLAREVMLRQPERREVNINVVPIENDSGEYDGAVVMLRDTTAERLKHDRLARMKKMGAFSILAAGIAHEVGNPLNSLGIHLQLLERKIGNLENGKKVEMLELLSVTKEEVNRLEHIISQFLKAAHQAPPGRKEADIVAILDKTLDFMGHEIRRRGVTVEKAYGEPVPPLLLDADQIRQVFINLVQNALQAMPHGGKLTVEVRCESGQVVVGFTDTGCGIAEEDMEKIFEPYYTTRSEGAGLGLMIVQRVINGHGGDCIISSSLGRGTTATVRIPVPPKYRRLIPGARPGKKTPGGPRRRALR